MSGEDRLAYVHVTLSKTVRALKGGLCTGASPGSVAILPESWDEMETKALLQFVLFHGTADAWPKFTRSSQYWVQAAEFVKERTGRHCKWTAISNSSVGKR